MTLHAAARAAARAAMAELTRVPPQAPGRDGIAMAHDGVT